MRRLELPDVRQHVPACAMFEVVHTFVVRRVNSAKVIGDHPSSSENFKQMMERNI
jgi:hypothetical protein